MAVSLAGVLPVFVLSIVTCSKGVTIGISSLFVASAVLFVGVGRVGRLSLFTEFTGLCDSASTDTKASAVAVALTLVRIRLHNSLNAAITSTTEGELVGIPCLLVASAVLFVSIGRVG